VSEASTVSASSAASPVSARIAGLQPGEVYHYRIAALSTLGASYGPDRTFSTPGAPRREARVALPPPVLSGLRVAPRAFRRARSRHGATARIRFKLSTPASVQLRFWRHRGAHWAAVRGGRLSRKARRGSSRVHFGGWIGRRRLVRGRYRVLAQPVSATGRHGTARRATFRLR
jgi:hypothetical protein